MRQFKIFFLLSIVFIFMAGCQSIKETLSMKKKKSVDEFLIEKKNPLTVPPDFSKLPKPKEQEEIVNTEENIDLSEVIGEPEKKDSSKKTSNTIEKSLSEILKKK